MPYTADDIKKIRAEKNFSQQEFADVLGVTRELLNKMESGKRVISKATALLLDDFLRREGETVSHETQASDSSESYVTQRRKLKQAKSEQYMVSLVPRHNKNASVYITASYLQSV